MTIGDRLEKFCESKKMSQKAFADSVKLNKTTLNNIILGISQPSFPVLFAIAQEYKDLDLRWLITGNSQSLDFSEINEPPPQYKSERREPEIAVKEIYIPVPARCVMGGEGCAFERLAKQKELEAELERLRSEVADLKKEK